MILKNGLQVWRSLLASGVELERKNRLPGYDSELVHELHETLYPNSPRSFEKDMMRAPPSTEVFLDAFFKALKPFAEMLREVLAMFENAGARRTNENLRIAFDFDKASEKLSFSLQQFRDVEVFFRRVTRDVIERSWNSESLWGLSRDVESVITKITGLRAWEYRRSSVVEHTPVRNWIENNGKPNWLQFPGFPTTGNSELDKHLHLAQELVNDMVAQLLRVGATYREFQTRIGQLPTDEEAAEINSRGVADDLPRADFVRPALDFWPNFFVENVCLLSQVVGRRAGESEQIAAGLAVAIQTGFERPPQTITTKTALEREFLELINLPIWKKRHELYAVWVCSRIADALKDLKWVWHPDGDTLHFSFSGAELATITGDDATFVFWTEKRTPLVERGVLGRKHIQPDYRVMTAPTHRPDATSLVVECKQYRRWSKKNFGAALDDYAKGCPNAPVILVNYGPTDTSILSLVDPSRLQQTHLVGNFKPSEDAALQQFRKLVRAAYFGIETAAVGGKLNLSWGPQFEDLDLHLFITPRHMRSEITHIGFGGDDGTLADEPYADWEGDVRTSPPGTEQVVIARWLDADYDLLVNDYSEDAEFPRGDVRLGVVIGDGSEQVFRPPNELGPWWHVCKIHGPDGRIEEINQVRQDCPYEDLV